MKDMNGSGRKGPAREIYHGHPDRTLHGAGVRREDNEPRVSYRGPAPRTGGRVNVPAARRVDPDARPVPAAKRVVSDAVRPAQGPVRPPRRVLPPDPEKAPMAPPAEEMEADNILAGRNPIREALRAGREIDKIVIAKGPLSGAAREIVQLARENNILVQETDRSRLDAVYPAHQGMIAYLAQAEYHDVSEMLALARERGEEPFLMILDGITDPYNLGAVIRTAECAGAHGVIVPRNRAAGLGPACAKAAAGALSHMMVARVTNLNREIDALKEEGVWIVGTAMDGEDAFTADLSGPIALVIGSEGDGISRLTLEKCDRVVSLPMKGHIGSLNASVAAGILQYEVMRRRQG